MPGNTVVGSVSYMDTRRRDLPRDENCSLMLLIEVELRSSSVTYTLFDVPTIIERRLLSELAWDEPRCGVDKKTMPWTCEIMSA